MTDKGMNRLTGFNASVKINIITAMRVADLTGLFKKKAIKFPYP